jgi:hypothetical protein
VGPLLPLLRKGCRWRWGCELQTAFEALRAKFAASIELIHPDADMPYSIYTDACRYGISAILMQRDANGQAHIVSTASRVLTAAECKFSVCELELLAVVYALQKFRLYIFGQHVIVYSDNKALSFMKRCNLVSNRITRWIMQIQEYDLEIIHIKGTDNFLADILSRHPVGLTGRQIENMSRPREVLVSRIDLDIDPTVKRELRNLSAHQTQDPRIQEIRQKLAQTAPSDTSTYKIESEVLYCRDKFRKYWRPYLPSHLEKKIIKFVHCSLGHSGTDKCIAQIAHSFYVKNLGRKVRRFVASCTICQMVKHPNRNYDTEIRSHLPREPGSLLAIDLYGNLPGARWGLKYILVCLDTFSKHVKLYPLRAATTKACLNKLTGHYFTQVRRPKAILSDHGTQFNNSKWRSTLTNMGIEVKYSPIRHPQSNPSERVMRGLGTFFKIYCHDSHKKWPEVVSYAENFINSTTSSSTGFTPMELMFGKPAPDLFKDVLKKTKEQEPEEVSLQDKWLRACARMELKATERKLKRKVGNAKWDPKVSDMVLVRIQPTSDAAQGITAKFIRPFEGPYQIVKVYPPATYEIADAEGKVRGRFNKRSLKPFLKSEDDT